jgi:hypothetical protein
MFDCSAPRACHWRTTPAYGRVFHSIRVVLVLYSMYSMPPMLSILTARPPHSRDMRCIGRPILAKVSSDASKWWCGQSRRPSTTRRRDSLLLERGGPPESLPTDRRYSPSPVAQTVQVKAYKSGESKEHAFDRDG